MSKTKESTNIAIIGAGIGGLTAAITLQDKLGLYDYTVFDLASDIGGTWRQNSYPGCACDVPAHWYSLSTDPNPNWTHVFAPRQEIFTYWKGLAKKHNLGPRIKFNTEFVSAVWNENEQNYTLNLRDVKTQELRQVTAKVVISAVGVFHHPRWPDIPGRELFQGDTLHAQMWDHSVNLSGKRVALIGNGCAGSQILPVISEDSSTTVINFCRTPSWYAPRPQAQVPEWLRWTFQRVPFALRAFRYLIAGGTEVAYFHFKRGPISDYFRARLEKALINYMKRTAPEKYHERLTPNYPLGCKRVVADPDYLISLNRPNVDLEWDPIAEITSNGIKTKSGKENQFDVICFATGFDIEGSLALDVKGINGQSLQEYYDLEGGPTGYMGTTIPGFPNWITLFGPNTATGHASVIYGEELQVNYALKLLKPVIQGKISSFVPRNESTRAWNIWLQSGLKHHVWPSCFSWYRAAGPDGKIIALWPGSNTHMWWWFRKPTWKHFEMVGGEGWLIRQRILEVLGITFQIGVLAAGVGALTLMKMGKWEDFVEMHRPVVEQALASCRALLS